MAVLEASPHATLKQWAVALADKPGIEQDSLELLLQLTSDASTSGELLDPPLQRHIAHQLTPLLNYLDKSNGQHVDALLPKVLGQLQKLTTNWLTEDAGCDATHAALLETLVSARGVLFNARIPVSARHQLSTAVGELIVALLKAQLPSNAEAVVASISADQTLLSASPQQPVSSSALPPSSPAAVLLRVLAREPAFSNTHGGLPVLPADARTILSWLTTNWLGSTGGAGVFLLASDDKPLLLLSRLTRAMLATGDRASDIELHCGVLSALVAWACNVVRNTLAKVLQPDGSPAATVATSHAGDPSGPTARSGAITRAAARLAAGAMQGLLTASDTGRALSRANGDTAAAEDGVSDVSAPPDAVVEQLQLVLEVLVDLVETCMVAAGEMGPGKPDADRLLSSAAAVVEDCRPLLAVAAPVLARSTTTTAVLSRLKLLLMAAAAQVSDIPPPAPAPAAAAANGAKVALEAGATRRVRGRWEWDVTQPLAKSYAAQQGTGWGAQHLCCSLAEALCSCLAGVMAAGGDGPERMLLLLPLPVGGPAGEACATALAMARLFVLRDGDVELGRAMLPLLTDTLVMAVTATPAVGSPGQHASQQQQQQQGAAAAAPKVPSSVVISLAYALAGMAWASGQGTLSAAWTYEQCIDVTLRLARDFDSPAGRALATGAAPGASAGALATALLQLASGLADARPSLRRDLRQRLLMLFSELGLHVGGPNGPAVVAEMRALLPVVAAACTGLGSEASRAPGSSSSRWWLSSSDLQGPTTKTDMQLLKLLRNFWLYVGLLRLAPPHLPEAQAAVGKVAGETPLLVAGGAGYALGNDADVVERLKGEFGERLVRAGAAADPATLRATLMQALALAPGSGPQLPPDACRQAYVLVLATSEMARASAGPLDVDGDTSPMESALEYLHLAQPFKEAEPLLVVLVERSFREYLKRLAALQERALRAKSTAIKGDTPALGYSFSLTPNPTSSAPGMPAATGKSAFAAAANTTPFPTLQQQQQAGARAGDNDVSLAGGFGGGGLGLGAVVNKALEGLAVTLIRHLGGGSEDGGVQGWSPAVVRTCDKLLKALTEAYPSLYWSHACLECLLDMLEAEEGDRGLNVYHSVPSLSAAPSLSAIMASTGGATPSLVGSGTASGASNGGYGAAGNSAWRWLQAWVAAGAMAAPSRTEALLHQFMQGGADGAATGGLYISSSHASVSASAAVVVQALRQAGPAMLSGEAMGEAAGLFGGGGAGAGAAVTNPAYIAALRRGSDLLGVCADARRHAGAAPGAALSQGHGDSAMALCRKLYYAGSISRASLLAAGPGSAEAALALPDPYALALVLAEQLAAAAATSATLSRELETRYMSAAAFLASPAGQELGTSYTTSTTATSGDGPPGAAAGNLQEEEEEGDSARSGPGAAARAACYQLVASLCSVPMKRFTPDVMSVAVFAWTWVTSAGPAWLVPLTSRLATDWSATVDAGVGLFSGAWHDTDTSAASPSASSSSSHAGVSNGSGSGAAGGSGGGNGDNGDSGVPAASAAEATLLSALACHAQWVAYLYELWAVLADRPGEDREALAQVYVRLLNHALQDPSKLSSHPAAAAPRFRLLRLALAFCQHATRKAVATQAAAGGKAAAVCPFPLVLLHDRTIRAGLQWFEHAPAYSARMTQAQADDQAAALQDFMALLERDRMPRLELAQPTQRASSASSPAGLSTAAVPPHPVWGALGLDSASASRLLLQLCRHELDRMHVWARPLALQAGTAAAAATAPAAIGADLMRAAWQVSPRLAVVLASQHTVVPPGGAAAEELSRLLVAHVWDTEVQTIPEAAMLLPTPQACRTGEPHLAALATWAPAGAVEGLQLIAEPSAARCRPVKAYAIRCLHAADPNKLVFFLPQLVQALRHDSDSTIAAFLKATASTSDLFAHQLLWALATEMKPPQETFDPEVKRSGWTPPRDTGLWEVAGKVRDEVLASCLNPASQEYWNAEDTYFNRVTSISGVLKKLDREERRGHIAKLLAEFQPPRDDLYVPTNPDCRVINHIPKSGTPMQSAAKVPILVAFEVEQARPAPLPPLQRRLACIFKVGDDVRQDVLALQVISLLRDAFRRAGLGAYLRPYGCIPTGYECGVIEVVPNTKSRAALGDLTDRGLYDVFQAEFGAPGGATFEAARHAFISSAAGYAVASFLLQAKDRHNGNLLYDSHGRLVHIDFGFILEISPARNMGFESAAFKLSHEMTQLLDPGNTRTSAHYRHFQELVVRGYLAARTVAEPIIATVALMAESGLPCFGRGAPVANLRRRFNLDMSDRQAASFMLNMVDDAYQKWTTGFYDYIQALQNKYPY